MSTSANVHLRARDLRRSFQLGSRKIEVLKGISVDILHGESVFLVGASGAGKTTLLYTLAGLEHPEEGTVELEGELLYRGSERAQAKRRNERVGYVFQGYFLLSELTALENVMLPSIIGGKAKREAAEAMLVKVGLADRMQHLPPELSGGEQQRVAIARALINNPSIIFADEPTGNLDSKTGAGIVDLLMDLVQEQNKTLVVVTHDPNLATRGTRRLEIRDGILLR
jgi:putative ABC transport system ATP-binding protein/lipoprotein-releasing system ATP-binding protein